MNSQKLIPLEALRALASLYVFLHHTLYSFELLEEKSFFWYFFNFGQEAVIVFFILSGFVISNSLEKNNYPFKIYFLHRFTRIYSVVFIAYIVSYICWIIYSDTLLPSYIDFVLNLLMLQDSAMFRPGTIVSPLFGNNPLWSLSYEWWFYIIFFAHFLLQKNTKIDLYTNTRYAFYLSLFGMITFYFYPNQISTFLMYYVIWFSGTVLNYDAKNATSNYLKTYLLLLLFIIVYILIFTVGEHYITSVKHPFFTLRHFLALFIFLLIFLSMKKYFNRLLKISFVEATMQFFSKFASISFAIYLIHYPIMNAIKVLSLSPHIKLLITGILTLILAYFTERIFYPLMKRIIFDYASINKISHKQHIKENI